MGLNVDTALLRTANWPDELLNAIEAMKRSAISRTVVPSSARKLLVIHVHPLQPQLQIADRLRPFDVSWNDFRKAGVDIQNGSDNWLSTCIGEVMIELTGWARNSRKSVPRPNPYCDLCWRHTHNNRKYCMHHDPQLNDSAYRVARRRVYCTLPGYNDVARNKTERANNLDSRMQILRSNRDPDELNEWEKVLSGKCALGLWLSQHRPWLYSQLPESIRPNIDTALLLDWLDSDDHSPQSLKQARSKLHAELLSVPDQLTGLIRRADAWFWLEEQYRKFHPHGGHGKHGQNTQFD